MKDDPRTELLAGIDKMVAGLNRIRRVVDDWQQETDRPATLIERTKNLRDFIGHLESLNNYNAYFGAARSQDPVFTAMAIRAVRQWQDEFVAGGSMSSAVGKYQIIRATLDGLVENMALTGEELFNPAIQDAMAVELMREKGLDAYVAGALDENQFMLGLARIWAALPNPFTGRSVYGGDGLNKALTTIDDFRRAVRTVRQ